MKKKSIAYLMITMTLIFPNLSYFGFLFYFRQLQTDEIIAQTIANPFYHGFFLLALSGMILILIGMDRKIKCYHQNSDCEEELESLQKRIVKFPSMLLVYSFLYSIIIPQFLLFRFNPTGEMRLNLTLLSMANLLLIGTPFYIYFIRYFEDYCSRIPFSAEYLSMKLSTRTLLVTMLSLFSLSTLTYLSIKVSANVLGLTKVQLQVILKTATPLVAFGVTLTSVCIYLLMSGINKRIYLSQDLMKILSQRDYSSEDTPIPSRDELGVVIHEINLVRKDTGLLLKEIREKANRTIDTKQNLITVAEESSSAMTEMTSNIQSVGNSITNLDNNINNVTSSMENLSQFIQGLTNSMGEQVSAQEESTAAIEEMTASIDSIAQITEAKMNASEQLKDVSDKGEKILKNTIEQIGKIFESLDRIKDMTKLILTIASQTNLLAMNAAIEAAHAGDAGRGFSVVADEIRKLAETSSTNSKSINESIVEIVTLVEGATTSGGETTRAFGEINQGIHEMMDSLKEITTGMSELKTGGGQILGAVNRIRTTSDYLGKQSESMNEETEKVNKAAAGLTQISAEARIAMDEMAVGAREVLESSLSLNDHAGELDETSKELENWIGQFKI